MPERAPFISWDGPQVSYLTGLFLPIFTGLKARGQDVAVLQFTWGEDQGQAEAVGAAGLAYRRVEVKRDGGPLGPMLTAWGGGADVDAAVADWEIDLLLPRSLMPALAAMRSHAGRHLPILFDADGLPADERVEFGGDHRLGPTYAALRLIERSMTRLADHRLVRTPAAADILARRAGMESHSHRFTVVPNPRVSGTIADMSARKLGAGPHLVYVGSLGEQYRPVQMLRLVAALRETLPQTSLTIFSRERGLAAELINRAGLDGADFITVETVTSDELARRLPAFDAGLALRTSSLSMQAVSPIKIGDYLMAGLPIIGSASIGDVTELLAAGVMIGAEGEADAPQIAHWLSQSVMPQRQSLRPTARALGERLYSLNRTVSLYEQALRAARARKG